GIPRCLTFYRVNSSGLSSNLNKQFLSWERAIGKASMINPNKVSKWSSLARAYQLRYLARHAVKAHRKNQALKLVVDSLKSNKQILFEEPLKTLITLFSAISLKVLPKQIFVKIEKLGYFFLSKLATVNVKI
ncbi:MAG: hypothetical protein OQJ89_08020, partial [Kangiellaceae bacterium]|nr:hypothetical protein [Kangiellaceae bacterium]